MLTLNIHPEITVLEEQIIAFRHHFHRHPELGFKEVETARYILDQIRDLDVDVQHPVAKTGIVVTMHNGDGPCVALRADMDALPIQETNELPFKSINDGVMHACGHDGHMAMLLGTMIALNRLRDRWQGSIKFIFQPAEEGEGGARHMVSEGVLKNPDVTGIFGLHLWNYQEFGTVGIKPGPVMAAADAFELVVRGKGGHGAMPQGTVDAVYVAAHLVMALQSIISRSLDPLQPGVVSIGSIKGGYSFNIIADKVTLQGTARAYREADRELIKSRLRALCDATATAYDASITMDYRDGYPPTLNDPTMTEVARRAAIKVAGDGVSEPYLTMGGEDMTYFLKEVPGCYIFLGSAKPRAQGNLVPHHCSYFDFDERALAVGASIFIEIVQDLLPIT